MIQFPCAQNGIVPKPTRYKMVHDPSKPSQPFIHLSRILVMEENVLFPFSILHATQTIAINTPYFPSSQHNAVT